MTRGASCPDPARLKGLLEGGLPADEQATLGEHLEGCASCQGALEGLAADSACWAGAARHLRAGAPAHEGALRQAVAELEAEAGCLTEAQDTLPAEEPALGFLSPPAKPGQLGRLGPYEVLEVLGRGGMGVVFKAVDPALDRVVAVKVLAPQLTTSAAARKRFAREARATAAVSHDHVVAIHAVDEGGGLPYLVMEFVAGKSLQERIDRGGPLAVKEVLRIGMQVAEGLAAAHRQGLVHRDVKPGNILLENGIERVKITDFGLARAADDASLTQSGVVSGTPQYMSPEQAEGKVVDHRADLFGLGSVLYAMCCGRPPFRAETTLGVLRRICEDRPRPIPEINPDVPPCLVAIIEKLHAKDPADRFQSAAEVAELLGGHLAHLQQPALVQRPPDVERPAAPRAAAAPRRRWLAAAALPVLLLAGLGAAEATGVSRVTATVLRVLTPEGTLVVEVEDPGVKVAVDGDEIAINGAGVGEVRLRPGRHQWQASKGGAPVRSDWVTISRGGKQVVRVRPEAAPGRGRGATPARRGVIPKGMRAYTIPTRPGMLAGFLLPGSKVDVLLTVAGEGDGKSGRTRTLLQNVEVLAVTQGLDVNAAGRPDSVTLLVTPEEVVKLAAAEHNGVLHLALRGP